MQSSRKKEGKDQESGSTLRTYVELLGKASQFNKYFQSLVRKIGVTMCMFTLLWILLSQFMFSEKNMQLIRKVSSSLCYELGHE